MLSLIRNSPKARIWDDFRDSLTPSTLHGPRQPSPVVQEEIWNPEGGDFLRMNDRSLARPVSQTSPSLGAFPRVPDHVLQLVDSYITRVQIRSPVADLEALRKTVAALDLQSFALGPPNVMQVPKQLTPADIAIFFLIISLGDVAEQRVGIAVPGERAGSIHFSTALSWLGPAIYDSSDPVLSLQVQVLLAAYYMWVMRPWKAWTTIDMASTMAEKYVIR